MAVPHLPTPDFYRYPWVGLSSATLDGAFVGLGWPDGCSLRVHHLWLVENHVGTGIDPITREMVLDPVELPVDQVPASASVGSDGALEVVWAPSTSPARFHPGWLRHVATGDHRPHGWLPDPKPWTAGELGEPPSRDGSRVLDDDDVLAAWLHDLVEAGIGRLRNVGDDADFLRRLGRRVGALRETNFGVVWDVKAVVDPNTTANTNQRLGPHTDLPTRETPPGFQFLHCITNTCSGGWSRMTDGLAVATHLEEHEPEHYEALTTLRWVFFNRGPGIDHRWSGPIIDRSDGHPITFRAFYPVRAFPDMSDADIERSYAAMRRFSALAADDRFQIGYPFESGDVVGFDNRRVLHGRDAFDESAGRRHLRGCYVDHDEIHSRLRVLKRAAADGQSGA